jgi:hypothetical protein
MRRAQRLIYPIPNGNEQAMAWVNSIGGGENGGTAGFGNGIAIYSTKDAAIFITMNQVGAQPVAKGIEILRRLP